MFASAFCTQSTLSDVRVRLSEPQPGCHTTAPEVARHTFPEKRVALLLLSACSLHD